MDAHAGSTGERCDGGDAAAMASGTRLVSDSIILARHREGAAIHVTGRSSLPGRLVKGGVTEARPRGTPLNRAAAPPWHSEVLSRTPRGGGESGASTFAATGEQWWASSTPSPHHLAKSPGGRHPVESGLELLSQASLSSSLALDGDHGSLHQQDPSARVILTHAVYIAVGCDNGGRRAVSRVRVVDETLPPDAVSERRVLGTSLHFRKLGLWRHRDVASSRARSSLSASQGARPGDPLDPCRGPQHPRGCQASRPALQLRGTTRAWPLARPRRRPPPPLLLPCASSHPSFPLYQGLTAHVTSDAGSHARTWSPSCGACTCRVAPT